MKLEEKFFKKFHIEPLKLEYPDNSEYYPEITSEILLKLFCALKKHYNLYFWENCMDVCSHTRTNVLYRTTGDFKCTLLSSLSCMAKEDKKLVEEVQKIFKEETWEA